MIHHGIWLPALERSETMHNQTIGSHGVLIFDPVNAFVTTAKMLLANAWFAHFLYCSINECPDVRQTTTQKNCMRKSIMVHPWLIDCLNPDGMPCVQIVQSCVENVIQLTC